MSHVILFICPYEVSLIVPLPPRGCVCILQTRPTLQFLFSPMPVFCIRHRSFVSRFFHFSDFGRIHLKFLLPFHIYRTQLPCPLYFIHLCVSSAILRPLCFVCYNTSPI